MSVPGKGETTKSNAAAESTEGQAVPSAHTPVVRDLIPIPLVIGIFAVVMAVTWFLLQENWYYEMTRYRSIAAQHRGDWEEASEHLLKLIEVGAQSNDPLVQHSPTFLSELAHSYLQQEKYQEALKYYEEAQKYRANLPPDDQGNPRAPADFQNMLGIVHYRMGNIDAAEKYLLGALQTNKLDPATNYTLGEINLKRGNYIKAADYFKTVANNPAYEEKVKKHYAEIEQKLFSGIT